MKAIANNIRISDKKLNVIAKIVRGMEAKKALDILRFMPNKGGFLIHKILESAIANAIHNDMQELPGLVISQISVTKGIVYKRGNPISRGRSHRILKRTSNVFLELRVK